MERPRPFPSRPRLIATIALLSVVLAQATATAQDPVVGQTVPAIEGPTWQLVEVAADEGLALIPPGVIAEVLFWNGGVEIGDGGCGTPYSTAYQLTRKGKKRSLTSGGLSVEAVEPSGAACDPAAGQVQDALLTSLPRAARWGVEGEALLLSDKKGVPLLRFTSAEVPQDVTIATWSMARSAGPGGALAPLAEGTEASVTFLPGGRVVGETGCGAFLGSYVADGTDISLSSIGSRPHDCPAEREAQAATILDALGAASSFDVRPAGMTLLDEAGTTRLSLTPTVPLGERNWIPTELLGAEGEVLASGEALATSVIHLTEGTADGRTPCGPFTATALRSGLAVSVFDLKKPKGSCKARTVEKLYLTALAEVASQALRGSRLELLDKDGETLVRLVPQPDLVGPQWVLTHLDVANPRQAPRLEPPLEGTVLTSTFDEDGFVSGSTGCNDYGAGYVASAGSATSLSIAEYLQDPKSCRTQVARQEALFAQRLREADGFLIVGDQLRLLRGTRVIAQYARAQAEA
jgi:heat shock protein HslJ